MRSDEFRNPPMRRQSGSYSIIDSHVPIAGTDYPESLEDLPRLIPDEHAARGYVEHLRFPTGFVCERCGRRGEPWRSGTGLLACEACRHPSPVVAGTLFEGSTISLMRWLRILWEATDREGGLTTQALLRLLATDDARFAQLTLSRIRQLMASPARSPLAGDVHVATGRLELGSSERPVIGIAMGRAGARRQRIRLRLIGAVSSREVVRFVVDHVHEGSRVFTTSWRGFKGIGQASYQHQVVAEPRKDIQRVLSLLKLWLWSNQDVSIDNVDGCLDDFVFRYNRREYPKGLLFYRLMMLATSIGHRGHAPDAARSA